jgi:hypothetical protein
MLVWPLIKAPPEPGGSVRRIPGLRRINRIAGTIREA